MKIAVAADLHLNNSTYGRIHNGLPLKTYDAIKALEFVVTRSIDEGVTTFVGVGDIYTTHCPGNTVRELANEQFQRLLNAEIEVYLMTGNHDWSHDSHSLLPMTGWHPHLHVVDKFQVVELPGCSFIFLPHTQEVQRKERTFKEYLIRLAQKMQKATLPYPIFFGHFGVNGAMQNDMSSNSCAEDPSVGDLQRLNTRRCFLGHYHKRQALDKSETIWYVGSHERERFDERDQAKGFCIYSVPDNTIQWVDYNARPMTNIFATSASDVQAYVEAHDLSGHIVRVHVQGDAGNYAEIQKEYKVIAKTLRDADVAHFIGMKKDVEDCEEDGDLPIPDLGERVDVYKLISDRISQKYEGKERDRLLVLLDEIQAGVTQQRKEVGLASQVKSVRFKWVQYHNFCAFGETDNTLNLDDLFGSEGGDLGDVLLILGAIEGDESDGNGTGKSSLLEGIAYALYEKIPRLSVLKDRKRPTTIEIIRTNSDNSYACREAYVTLCMDIDGDEWVIKRGRKLTKSGNHSAILEVTKNGSSESDLRNKDPNELIVEIVGIDYDSFCNCIFFAQKDTSRLFSATQKGRMDLFLMILGVLQDLDSALALIRKKAGENRKTTSQIEGEVSAYTSFQNTLVENEFAALLETAETEENRLSALINEKRAELKQIQKRVHNLQTAQTERYAQITAWRKEIGDLKAQHEEATKSLSERITGMRKTVKRERDRLASFKAEEERMRRQYKSEKAAAEEINEEVEKQIVRDAELAEVSLKEISRKIEEAQEVEKSFVSDRATVAGEVKSLQAEIDKYQAELDATDDDIVKCPHCGAERPRTQLIDKIEGLKVTIKIKQEEQDHAQKGLSDTKAEIVMLNKQKWQHEQTVGQRAAAQLRLQTRSTKLKRVEEIVKEAKALVARFKETEPVDIEAEERDIARLEEAINEKEVQLADRTKELVKETNDLDNQCASATKELKKLSDEQSLCEKTLERAQADKSKNDREMGQLKEKMAAIEERKKKLAEAQIRLKGSQQKDGDMAALDELFGSDGIRSDISAMYLPVFNKHMSEFMSILTDGRIDVSIDPRDFAPVIRGASAGMFEMLSGGEQDEVRLAGNLALGMLSLGSSKCLPDMLCLDEIFGALAPARKEKALELLRHLRSFFKRILVITHNPDLKERFDRRVRVNKVEDVSRLEMV